MPIHFHPPRPLHGWRAFFGEIAVIVIGVLIALTAEEFVTDWTWHDKVAEGEKGLGIEQADDFYYLAENVVVAPCVDAQLARLTARLVERNGPWQPIPLIKETTIAQVVRAPWRPIESGAWTAMVSDGTSTHLPSKRQALNIQFYTQLDGFAPDQDHVHAAIGQLRLLSEPIDLDTGSRVALVRDISALRGTVQSNALVARQMMATITLLGHAPAASDVDTFMKPAEHSTVAFCVASGLPMDDWRKERALGLTETRPSDSKAH